MAHRRSPVEGTENQECDLLRLFRARLDEMIDMKLPLVRVSHAMPWGNLIESVGESLPLVPVWPGRRPLLERLVLGFCTWSMPTISSTRRCVPAGWRIRITAIFVVKFFSRSRCRAIHRR